MTQIYNPTGSPASIVVGNLLHFRLIDGPAMVLAGLNSVCDSSSPRPPAFQPFSQRASSTSSMVISTGLSPRINLPSPMPPV